MNLLSKQILSKTIKEYQNIKSAYINGLLTKREVMMAVYWPSSFLHNFIDQDKVKVYKNEKKNNQMELIFSHLNWTSLVNNKGFII